MKKLKFSIGLLILSSLFLSFIPFVSKSYALDDINYNFKNDIFYENNTLNINNFDEYNNVRNTTIFTNTFNASYSFTNEIDGTKESNIDFIDVSNKVGSTATLQIVNNLSIGHDKVLEFVQGNVPTDVIDGYNEFTPQVNGTIEFWIRANYTVDNIYFRMSDDTTDTIYTYIAVNEFRWYDGGSNTITDAIADTWYHLRYDFECGAGSYLGLGADEFYITINGKRFGAYDFWNDVNDINRLFFATYNNDDNYEFYIDAIGYSWLSNYTINDNIVPYQIIDSESLEIDKYTFTFDSVGNTMSSGTDNPSGWIDVESGADRVNTALNDSGIKEHAVEIYSSIGADNLNSILKDDFNLNSERLNITFSIFFDILGGSGTRYVFEVKSITDNLVVWIEMKADGVLRWFTSDPPGTFIELTTNITTGIYYEFNIYIDYSADLGILRLSENGIHIDTFVNELVNIGQSGLSSIESIGMYIDGNIVFHNDYIGIYNNGSSIAKDLGYVVLDLHKDTYYLDSTHNNLATINISGNFHLIYASYAGGALPIYLLDSIFGSITDTFIIMNDNKRLFNFYDDGTIRYNPLLVVFLNNGSKGFKFNSVILEGAKITEGINTYWLEYSYDNILTNTSFFKVDNLNRLTFNLTYDDSNLEYIQANFNIDNIQTIDRAVYFETKKNSLGFAELRLLYPSISDIIKIPNTPNVDTSRTIISQNQTLIEFIFLISDNDIDAITGIGTGFIQNLRIIAISNLSTSIITLTLLGMIIPLVLIITPTFIFSNRLGKESVVPLFLIFSLIFTATETIPLWLFFIIAFSSLVFIFTNKDKMIK